LGVLWFAVILYLVLSPVVCLLIGRAIQVRDAERPVEACEPEVETAPAPVEAQTVVPAEVPVAS
jgi:hypothetical protein